ncbi:MAG: TetR/AcrR family transcriptional regulator [Thermoleophilia bacterium]
MVHNFHTAVIADEKQDVLGNPQTYERIIVESTHLMASKGYANTSLQDIADVVGIHKSSIFHHFKKKEDILVTIIHGPIQIVTRAIDEVENEYTLDGRGKLELAIRKHIQLQTRYAEAVRVYNRDSAHMSEESRELYIEMRRAYERKFIRILEQARNDGVAALQGVNLRVAAYGILGMCNWMVRWYRADGELQPEDIADTWIKMMLGRGQADA